MSFQRHKNLPKSSGQAFLQQGLASARGLVGKLFATKRSDKVVERCAVTLRLSPEQQQDVVIPPELGEKCGEQQVPIVICNTHIAQLQLRRLWFGVGM